MNDGRRDDLWVADADEDRCRGCCWTVACRCRLARRPRLVAQWQVAIVYSRTSRAGLRLGGSARWRRSTSRLAGYAWCSGPWKRELHGRSAVLALWPLRWCSSCVRTRRGRGPNAVIDASPASGPSHASTYPVSSFGRSPTRVCSLRRPTGARTGKRIACSCARRARRRSTGTGTSGLESRAANRLGSLLCRQTSGYAADPGLVAGRHRSSCSAAASTVGGEPRSCFTWRALTAAASGRRSATTSSSAPIRGCNLCRDSAIGHVPSVTLREGPTCCTAVVAHASPGTPSVSASVVDTNVSRSTPSLQHRRVLVHAAWGPLRGRRKMREPSIFDRFDVGCPRSPPFIRADPLVQAGSR